MHIYLWKYGFIGFPQHLKRSVEYKHNDHVSPFPKESNILFRNLYRVFRNWFRTGTVIQINAVGVNNGGKLVSVSRGILFILSAHSDIVLHIQRKYVARDRSVLRGCSLNLTIPGVLGSEVVYIIGLVATQCAVKLVGYLHGSGFRWSMTADVYSES